MISPNTTAIECTGSLLRSASTRVEVVGIDLSDMIVVATSDAVLVAPKSSAQRVKEAVSALEVREIAQAVSFPTDYRPCRAFSIEGFGVMHKQSFTSPTMSSGTKQTASRTC